MKLTDQLRLFSPLDLVQRVRSNNYSHLYTNNLALHSFGKVVIHIAHKLSKFIGKKLIFFPAEGWVDNSKEKEALDILRIPQTFSRNKQLKHVTDNFILL